MVEVPSPPDEAKRLQRLAELRVLDTGPDPVLDALVQRAMLLLPGIDSAAISLVDRKRVWFKACAGRQWMEAPRSQSLCAHAILQHGVMVVEDAWRDQRFADHPFVTGEPGIRFYAGAPLEGQVGVLCVIGLWPRRVTQTELGALTVLARTISQRLTLQSAVQMLGRDLLGS